MKQLIQLLLPRDSNYEMHNGPCMTVYDAKEEGWPTSMKLLHNMVIMVTYRKLRSLVFLPVVELEVRRNQKSCLYQVHVPVFSACDINCIL